MSEYIVSARKYRPDNFESLIGQDNIARTLKNSILRNQLAHAYLFCGPRGVGKTTTARIFAKMINCSNPKADGEPCGECESCRSFAEGRSYCIHELDAASNNGVDDMKALIDQVRIPPQTGRYSVYIIDEVHMLSTSAFNAFLKTLEEPPQHAIFILATTEKHKILPTILSRCQTYDFNRITIEDIVRNLRGIATREEIEIDDESLHIIAQKADGAMRDALTIFDQTVAFCGRNVKLEDVMKNLNVLGYEHCFSLVDDFLSGDYASALLKFDEVLSKGFNALHFVSALSSHLRDLTIARTAGLESLLELPASLKERYAAQAGRCSLKFLFDALAITQACEGGYRAAVNPRLHIEFALMRLSFLMKAPAGEAAPAPKPAAAPAQAPVPASTPVASPAPTTAPAAPETPMPKPEPAPIATPAPEPAPIATPAPAAEPSPAPAAAPAQTPRRRRDASGAAPMSMRSRQATATETEASAEEAVGEEKLPAESEIRVAWPRLSEIFSNRPRLASAIANCPLEVAENGEKTKILFKMDNEAQQKFMLDPKIFMPLQEKLIELLGTRRFELEVGVVPAEKKVEVKYMPQEQAEAMIQDNPELGNLLNAVDATIK